MTHKKKTRLKRLLIAVLLLVSFAVLLYPTFSSAWNQYRSSQLMTQYQQAVSSLSEEKLLTIRQEAESYNQNHENNYITDVFDEEAQGISSEEYSTLLNVVDGGIMGYLEIPKIWQKLSVYHGTGAEVLEKGVGHLEGTSLPVGGTSTHSVLAAHRGLPGIRLFTDLDQMEIHDRFFLYIAGTILEYEIDSILTVEPEEVEYLDIVPDMDYVTLLTCTPYSVNSHRLLVRGHRVPYVEEHIKEETKKINIIKTMDVSLKAFFAETIGCVLLLLLVIIRKHVNKRVKT